MIVAPLVTSSGTAAGEGRVLAIGHDSSACPLSRPTEALLSHDRPTHRPVMAGNNSPRPCIAVLSVHIRRPDELLLGSQLWQGVCTSWRRRCVMKRWAGVLLAVFALLLGNAVPSAAAPSGGGGHGGGGGHVGGGHVGGGHIGGGHPGGGHWSGGHWNGGHWGGSHWRGSHWHGGGWWWPGVALGVWGYPYYDPYYYPYSYPSYGAPYSSYEAYQAYVPPTVTEEQPQSPSVQREVVHPNGKYVLHGDGISQPWQWVWVPNPPPPPPGPASQ